MKKICLSVFAMILLGTAGYAADKGGDVQINQDKKGNIEVKSDLEIKQIRCFNEEGKKMTLDVSKNKKQVMLGNNLEKGVWYFQVRTSDGEVAIKKVEIH